MSPKPKPKDSSRRNAKKPHPKRYTLTKPFRLAGLVSALIQDCSQTVHPLILQLPGAIRSGNLEAIKVACDTAGSPQLYGDPDTYLANAQIVAVVSKFPFEGDEAARESAALTKFRAAEETCAKVNQRFRSRSLPFWVTSILNKAALLIEQTLGPFSRSYESILDSARHGPGASLCLSGPKTSAYYKMAEGPWSASEACVRYVQDLVLLDPALGRLLRGAGGIRTLPGHGHNKLTFVPKNAWTLRGIAIEPRLNMYLQLGTGLVMSRLLHRIGIDISDQGKNQELAFQASLTGDGIATVDLSSASDTIAEELVRYLFRGLPDWMDFLYDLRSSSYRDPEGDVLRPYEKWSSMGNGYTFPLETLLFWALSRVCVDEVDPSGVVSVYGDDIIIPSAAYTKLTALFHEVGFNVNASKTFSQGPFRESCGRDFWYGVDVRPIFLTDQPSCAGDIFHLANSLLGVSRVFSMADTTRTWLLGHLRPEDTLYGPKVEDTRAHLWAPVFWLYQHGYLRYRKRHQSLTFNTTRETALQLRPEVEEAGREEVLLYLWLREKRSRGENPLDAHLWAALLEAVTIPDLPNPVEVNARALTRVVS